MEKDIEKEEHRLMSNWFLLPIGVGLGILFFSGFVGDEESKMPILNCSRICFENFSTGARFTEIHATSGNLYCECENNAVLQFVYVVSRGPGETEGRSKLTILTYPYLVEAVRDSERRKLWLQRKIKVLPNK